MLGRTTMLAAALSTAVLPIAAQASSVRPAAASLSAPALPAAAVQSLGSGVTSGIRQGTAMQGESDLFGAPIIVWIVIAGVLTAITIWAIDDNDESSPGGSNA